MPKTIKSFMISEMRNLGNFIYTRKYYFLVCFIVFSSMYYLFKIFDYRESIAILGGILWGGSVVFWIDIMRGRWKRFKEGD